MKTVGNKILVTGGYGFIGSNFIRYMLKKYPSFHIVNLDKLTSAANQRNLTGIEDHSNYSFIKKDIVELKNFQTTLKNVDYIVHFAAETHVDRSIKNPEIFVKTNVLGTYNLLESAMRKGIKKFVYVSTDEVYGSLPGKGRFTERSPFAPNSPYSASKAAGDMLARSYYQTYGFPVVISRCSNNYGPNQNKEKLVPLMIARAKSNQKLPVYGDGRHVRDWLHVEDHCYALDLILQKGKVGEAYNIGDNNEWENIKIVKLILKYLGKPESLIEYIKDRPGHDRRYAVDSSKIRKELGWLPKKIFLKEIRSTIDWYINNQN